MSTLRSKLEILASRGTSAELCSRLADLVENGDPAVLARLAPPRLAVRWGLPEPEVLDAFLQGTREGLFELEWDVRCMSCTGPTAREFHLGSLRTRARCEMCALDFQASFDEAIEVTWRVHPSVRDLSDVSYTAVFMAYAEPRTVAELEVPAGGETGRELELEEGHYHMFKADRSARRGLRVDAARGRPSGSLPFEVVVTADALDRGEWTRGAGRHALVVRNRSASDVQLVINRVTDQPWVSGARLAAHQGFRDLFARELISADESFAIRSAAFVFTDLKGSTELYERIGDSRAYALVRDHFRIMVDQVRLQGGAMVKTIGDAIMATFISPAAAVRFAVSVLDEFDRFNAGRAARREDDVVVKIGVHAGPCIAVTLNERLDYFGRTVNTAARIQGLSEGRDIVLSRAVAEASEVQGVLAQAAWKREPFGASLKGIPGEQQLVRLRPNRG
jgi:class 3 adenylate cyclase